MIRGLDGETRRIDAETVVISDGQRPVALGGIIGGAESEITSSTRNVFLECAWFSPATIRRTARRLGIKTDASYRFERGVDPSDAASVIDFAAGLVVRYAGGTREPIIDVVAAPAQPKTILLRSKTLHDSSAGVIGDGYALALFRRLGFGATAVQNGLDIVVPTHRSDVGEEMDLVEEVLRFYGLDRIPAVLPRVTSGDAAPNPAGEAEDKIRQILAGSGLSEAINYSFIHQENNALFADERPILLSNALSENVGAMRLSLLPGLLETVAFNRSYGTRDGSLFEIGRTYHRAGEGVREHRRLALVMYGAIGSHWGDPKRAVDFFDAKGIVEQVATTLHVDLQFTATEVPWLKKGRRAEVRHGERVLGSVGFLTADVLQKFGIKGEVAAAQIDLDALLESTELWKMAPVSRFPGVPMILALTHGPDLEYQRLVDTIRSLGILYLHEVGLRDRFVPEGESHTVKTTLGMWYQANDRSLTQEEIGAIHKQLAARVAELLPVKLLS